MQNYMMLLQQRGHIVLKGLVKGNFVWLDYDQSHVCLVKWLECFFCLYVKLFLPSTFQPVDFRSSMPCVVLDIELADKNVLKELGKFFDGNVQALSFCLQNGAYALSLRFDVQEICTDLCATVDGWGYSEFPNFLPKDVKGEKSAKRIEKCKTFGSLMDK